MQVDSKAMQQTEAAAAAASSVSDGDNSLQVGNE